MKFRVSATRGKSGSKQTKAATAGGAKPSSSRKRRKGPHTDLPEDPIEEPMPLYGDDDEYDQDFAPMEEESIVVSQAKEWPPGRSRRTREKEPQSQQSSMAESQPASAAPPEEACYKELQAFREKVWSSSCTHLVASMLTFLLGVDGKASEDSSG